MIRVQVQGQANDIQRNFLLGNFSMWKSQKSKQKKKMKRKSWIEKKEEKT